MLKNILLLFKWTVLLYILMGVAAQFLGTMGIRVFQELLDTIAQAHSLQKNATLILLYGSILMGATLLHYLLEFPRTVLSTGIHEQLKVTALAKVSKMDYSTYQHTGTGELLKLIDNGAQAGTGIVHSFYLRILHDLLPGLLFSLFFISRYNSQVVLIIGIGYLAVFLLSQLLLQRLYRMKSKLLASQEKMSALSVRGFMELAVFRLNRRYSKELERLQQTAGEIVRTSTRIRMIHEAFFALFAMLVNLIKLAILVYGARSLMAGHSSIGTIAAMMMFVDHIYSPIAIFNVLFVEYKLNGVAYKRFEAFLRGPEDIHLDAGKEVERLRGKIDFVDVCFRYGGHGVLHNVTFSIKPGCTTAVIGASGSGKSTIVKLMLGLLKTSSGQILVDGTDINRLKLDSLYRHLSYISQEAPVFDTTIRENIMFDEKLEDAEIYAILEQVQLKETVLCLPDGLETKVGERGMKLSGGERQRLALARVMAQQRNLVVLDEPVSALDNKTEKSLMDGILKIPPGKTVVIVAHRLRSIRNADTIIVVRNGEIAGIGNFASLIENSTYFRELWSLEETAQAAEQ
ncbi:MAG: transporter ATP-binding protein [Paenibacillaceae bacterium]|jgi:ATP-binding cassette subfamily B protein|nr:transporter ATP-binding protein [Paenibacillaceae bacterium]